MGSRGLRLTGVPACGACGNTDIRLFHNTEIDRYVARCSANITHHPGRTAETRDKAIQDWRDSRGVKARA